MELADEYYDLNRELARTVYQKNRETLKMVGASIANSIAEGGVLHTFGSGHSSILAQELVHRAGGLAPVSAIIDPAGGWPETIPGYGTKLARRHHAIYELKAGEVILVISNSGKTCSPIEVALEAKALGLTVVALTSLEVSRSFESWHESGKRLFEVADYILDNCGLHGDAAIPLPDSELKVGPTSTMSGALLLNLLAMEIMEKLASSDGPLPILMSSKLPRAEEHNARLSAKYKGRLSRPL